MTSSVHKESTGNVVYLKVCRFPMQSHSIFVAKLAGYVDCKMGGKLSGLPGSRSSCQTSKSHWHSS